MLDTTKKFVEDLVKSGKVTGDVTIETTSISFKVGEAIETVTETTVNQFAPETGDDFADLEVGVSDDVVEEHHEDDDDSVGIDDGVVESPEVTEISEADQIKADQIKADQIKALKKLIKDEDLRIRVSPVHSVAEVEAKIRAKRAELAKAAEKEQELEQIESPEVPTAPTAPTAPVVPTPPVAPEAPESPEMPS